MKATTIVAALAVLGLSACGNTNGANLIFGQEESAGVTISGSAPQQGGSLNLGYHSYDIAFVPVVVETPEGQILVQASTDTLNQQGQPAGRIVDALSTIGQFSLGTGQNTVVSAELGKFFATGNAAQVLAQGFADELRGNASQPTPPATQ